MFWRRTIQSWALLLFYRIWLLLLLSLQLKKSPVWAINEMLSFKLMSFNLHFSQSDRHFTGILLWSTWLHTHAHTYVCSYIGKYESATLRRHRLKVNFFSLFFFSIIFHRRTLNGTSLLNFYCVFSFAN